MPIPASIELPTGFRSIDAASRTRYVYREGDNTFVSFNNMHEIAPEPDRSGGFTELLKAPRRPMSLTRHFPFAAFALREIQGVDPNLARYLVCTNGIPFKKKVREGQEFFVLETGRKGELELFERALRKIVESVNSTGTPNFKLVAPTAPSQIGYDKAYRSYDELCRHVSSITRAFELYVAWTVYVVVSHAYRWSSLHNAPYSLNAHTEWAEAGVNAGWFKKEWIHQFLSSPTFDVTRNRVGTFISPPIVPVH